MTIEAQKLARAAACGAEFRSFLGDTPLTPLDKMLTNKMRLRWATLTVLAVGSNTPSPQDMLGMLNLFQIIRTCDDAIDRRPGDFSDPEQLRTYLLNSEVMFTGGARVSQVFERCLSFYPPDKQRAVNTFIDEMLLSHMQDFGRGVPGKYSFEDPVPYRRATNDPFADTLAELTGSDSLRFRRIALGIQLIDDASDCVEDLKDKSLNFFIGMATDVWHRLGGPNGEELDFLTGLLGKWPTTSVFAQKTKIDALFVTKNKRMRATRAAYRQQIQDQLPEIGGNAARVMGRIASFVL